MKHNARRQQRIHIKYAKLRDSFNALNYVLQKLLADGTLAGNRHEWALRVHSGAAKQLLEGNEQGEANNLGGPLRKGNGIGVRQDGVVGQVAAQPRANAVANANAYVRAGQPIYIHEPIYAPARLPALEPRLGPGNQAGAEGPAAQAAIAPPHRRNAGALGGAEPAARPDYREYLDAYLADMDRAKAEHDRGAGREPGAGEAGEPRP